MVFMKLSLMALRLPLKRIYQLMNYHLYREDGRSAAARWSAPGETYQSRYTGAGYHSPLP